MLPTKLNHEITRVVIPVAGLGTRFLPFSKTVPKEMLPVVDTPSILLLAEEALGAGFKEIILVQGRGKQSIEDFFDISYELEHILLKKNKYDLISRVENVRNRINIVSIRQKKPLGLGHAVLTAQSIIGNSPFAVMLGDELLNSSQDLSNLKRVHNETGISSVSVMEVPVEDTDKYGIISFEEDDHHRMKVTGLIEKPSPPNAPSRWALPGRYIFNSKIFDYLRETAPGVGDEIQLTDAMNKLAAEEGLYAIPIESKRYDLGSKLGFLKANIEYGLSDPQIAQDLSLYIQSLSKAMEKATTSAF